MRAVVELRGGVSKLRMQVGKKRGLVGTKTEKMVSV